MKIILSRKGFDSGYGGCASPIFPDGSMASFPIPDKEEDLRSMQHVWCGENNLGTVAQDLTRRRKPLRRIHSKLMIHLDPELLPSGGMCKPGWRAAFGQDSVAQSHLGNQSVGPGDLFLFFGWFRRVELDDGRWRYVPNEPDLHVIFGWLQVDEVLTVSEYRGQVTKCQWLKDHPHIRHINRYPENNSIYIASEKLVIGGQHTGQTGGGTFASFLAKQQLTCPDQPLPLKRSIWRLPKWFSSRDANGNPALTYHNNMMRWRDDATHGETVELHSAAIGQEFVLNIDHCPKGKAYKWLNSLFRP